WEPDDGVSFFVVDIRWSRVSTPPDEEPIVKCCSNKRKFLLETAMRQMSDTANSEDSTLICVLACDLHEPDGWDGKNYPENNAAPVEKRAKHIGCSSLRCC